MACSSKMRGKPPLEGTMQIREPIDGNMRRAKVLPHFGLVTKKVGNTGHEC